MSSTDETYLEAYLEQLTTSQWTYQVRRTMDLLRDMDALCSTDLQQLQSLTEQFHTQIEQYMIHNFDIVELDSDYDEDCDDEEVDVVEKESDKKNEKASKSKKGINTNNNDSYNQQNNNKKRKRPRYGIRLSNDPSSPAMIPTTEELFEYILQQPIDIETTTTSVTKGTSTGTNNSNIRNLRDLYEQIQALQYECIQKSHEKCYIAQQAYEMIDVQVQRLDNDIQSMENLLQINTNTLGEYSKSTLGNSNSNTFLQQQQTMSNSISNANLQHTNISAAMNNTIQSTIASSTMHSSSNTLSSNHKSNMIHSTKPLYAACQIAPGSEYILCKILFHDTVHNTYKLCDEDIESTNKIFDLPESQVIVLHSLDRLSKGDTIYAVYPDTTSFYQATVVQVPNSTRKQQQQQSSSSLAGQEQYIMVQFIDDADEFGITHDKAVPIQHIMLPPPQSLL